MARCLSRAIGRLQSRDFGTPQAQELDPLSGKINAYLGAVLSWARHYDASINQPRQAIGFDPTFVPNYVILCWALDAKDDTKASPRCLQATFGSRSEPMDYVGVGASTSSCGESRLCGRHNGFPRQAVGTVCFRL